MAPLNFSTTLTRYSLRHNCGLARPCSMGGDAQRRAQFWVSALYPQSNTHKPVTLQSADIACPQFFWNAVLENERALAR